MRGYAKLRKLGEGTYASVFLGRVVEDAASKLVKVKDPVTALGDRVAIKQVKKTAYSTGQEISAIREIKALKSVKHQYVLALLDVFIHKGTIYMILEYMDSDLERIIKDSSVVVMPGDIKAWMYMLLCSLNEYHRQFILHRDIKPNNLLIAANGILKLSDFGLSRKIGNEMTPQAITRWYRAPELLMGAQSYSLAADMWSVGAVFAEMFLRVPLFAAETDIQQLDLIFKALGAPIPGEWPHAEELPGYIVPKTASISCLNQLFSAAGDEAVELLRRLLCYNPENRISCEDALRHPYFQVKPFATRLEQLPKQVQSFENEYEAYTDSSDFD